MATSKKYIHITSMYDNKDHQAMFMVPEKNLNHKETYMAFVLMKKITDSQKNKDEYNDADVMKDIVDTLILLKNEERLDFHIEKFSAKTLFPFKIISEKEAKAFEEDVDGYDVTQPTTGSGDKEEKLKDLKKENIVTTLAIVDTINKIFSVDEKSRDPEREKDMLVDIIEELADKANMSDLKIHKDLIKHIEEKDFTIEKVNNLLEGMKKTLIENINPEEIELDLLSDLKTETQSDILKHILNSRG